MQSLLKTTVTLTALTIPMTAMAGGDYEDDQAKWAKMREKAVSASEILTGDVTNVLNPVGTVKELILSEDSGQLEYVLYDVPYPYGFYGTDDAFVRFDNTALEHGGYGDLNVRFDDEASAQAPDQLKLTSSQVDHRAVSRLIGEPVVFKKDKVRSLSDILVHPKSGKVTHFVVEMNPDAIFAEEPRALPADEVSIESGGHIQASLTIKEADKMSTYDSSML